MSDYAPLYAPGDIYTSTASATITGGQLVEVSGTDTVGPAGASSAKQVGVAAHDAPSGGRVSIYLGKIIHETTASGAITAGDQLVTAAAGQVSTLAAAAAAVAADINNARAVIGFALSTAANGAKVRWATK